MLHDIVNVMVEIKVAIAVLSCQRFERPIGSFPCAGLVLVGWPLSLRRTGVKNQRPALEFALVLLPATGYAGARG